MAIRTVGKLDDWNDADPGKGGSFMRLEEGDNVVRVITSPYQFYIHWTKDESNQSCKVRCAMENCPVCQRGENASARWFIGVLNKKGDKAVPSLLEISLQVYSQIKALKNKKNWGDPRAYDISITRKPKGSQPLYVVTPEPKAACSDEEKKMAKAFIEECDFEKLVAVPTPEEIAEKLGLAMPKNKTTVSTEFENFEAAPEETSTDDSDFDFSK